MQEIGEKMPSYVFEESFSIVNFIGISHFGNVGKESFEIFFENRENFKSGLLISLLLFFIFSFLFLLGLVLLGLIFNSSLNLTFSDVMSIKSISEIDHVIWEFGRRNRT